MLLKWFFAFSFIIVLKYTVDYLSLLQFQINAIGQVIKKNPKKEVKINLKKKLVKLLFLSLFLIIWMTSLFYIAGYLSIYTEILILSLSHLGFEIIFKKVNLSGR